MPEDYSAADIQVLEGVEAVRKRPGMYVGSTGPHGVRNLLLEVVNNSVDEHLAGHASRLEIQRHPDGAYTVCDDGRGIPVDQHPEVMERIFCTLHAGSTFDDHTPHVHLGMHGVGLAAVNALCALTTVVVDRNDARYLQTFQRGRALCEPTHLGRSHRRGTSVRFLPDPAIFGEVGWLDGLDGIARQVAVLNPNLEVVLDGQVHREPLGLEGLVRRRCAGGGFERIVTARGRAHEVDVDVAVALGTQSGHGDHVAFGNQLELPDGGVHLDAALELLEPLGKPVLVAVAVMLQAPHFAGRTRGRIENAEAADAVRDVLGPALAALS
ncbi:MAG: hypothetical protein KTR31_02780 [Myxococcales bacterium]|nr:hypothetical protein [Myxococcales bacterium]